MHIPSRNALRNQLKNYSVSLSYLSLTCITSWNNILNDCYKKSDVK